MDKVESYIKHKKYYSSYKPNDTYWGIGIENETYIEIPNDDKIDGSFFFKSSLIPCGSFRKSAISTMAQFLRLTSLNQRIEHKTL